MSAALAKIADVSPDQVSITDVGPTWGSQISEKALIAVLVFFVVVVVYISFRFEWKMAMAALIAVIHDLLVTAGIYSLAGFQVTPDTVIALLTILGYSLYDTVVVFDRVKENSRGQFGTGRMTYTDIVNLSMNQTLARSINTSLVAILPVLAVLVIGAQLLGATTLQYFGLALVIGLTSGAYSSIFIASPVLAGLKEREPRYINIRRKLENRTEGAGLLTPRQAAVLVPGRVDRRGARRHRQRGTRRRGRGARPVSCGPAPPPGPGRRRSTTTPTSTRTSDETRGPARRPIQERVEAGRAGASGSNGAGRGRAVGSASAPRRPQGQGSKKGGKRR